MRIRQNKNMEKTKLRDFVVKFADFGKNKYMA